MNLHTRIQVHSIKQLVQVKTVSWGEMSHGRTLLPFDKILIKHHCLQKTNRDARRM